ncbi:hypothetical protein DFH27DRAFT_612125 [Peziza echinospora]|nr:hypothetical protein DFH27DRAFT_612125 [Peziza echinospora]
MHLRMATSNLEPIHSCSKERESIREGADQQQRSTEEATFSYDGGADGPGDDGSGQMEQSRPVEMPSGHAGERRRAGRADGAATAAVRPTAEAIRWTRAGRTAPGVLRRGAWAASHGAGVASAADVGWGVWSERRKRQGGRRAKEGWKNMKLRMLVWRVGKMKRDWRAEFDECSSLQTTDANSASAPLISPSKSPSLEPYKPPAQATGHRAFIILV